MTGDGKALGNCSTRMERWDPCGGILLIKRPSRLKVSSAPSYLYTNNTQHLAPQYRNMASPAAYAPFSKRKNPDTFKPGMRHPQIT